jgi:hypothetical protein
MTTTRKILASIFGAHIVLIIFFSAFKFEEITLFLYSGTWVGIGLATFVLPRTTLAQKAGIIAGVFGVQLLVFGILDFAHMNDLMLEEIGFLSIGVWTGLLIGNLVRLIEKLKKQLAIMETNAVQSNSKGNR